MKRSGGESLILAAMTLVLLAFIVAAEVELI